MIIYNSELYHYGMPRRSGRYKWGSGKNPFHHGADAAFRKAKADYKANKKAINKGHRKSLRNVKDYRKVDSMVKNYKDARRTNKEAYAQAKKAYKQTAEYKAARRKKIAGIAAGTAAVAATAYLARHPEKRAQMQSMIKGIAGNARNAGSNAVTNARLKAHSITPIGRYNAYKTPRRDSMAAPRDIRGTVARAASNARTAGVNAARNARNAGSNAVTNARLKAHSITPIGRYNAYKTPRRDSMAQPRDIRGDVRGVANRVAGAARNARTAGAETARNARISARVAYGNARDAVTGRNLARRPMKDMMAQPRDIRGDIRGAASAASKRVAGAASNARSYGARRAKSARISGAVAASNARVAGAEAFRNARTTGARVAGNARTAGARVAGNARNAGANAATNARLKARSITPIGRYNAYKTPRRDSMAAPRDIRGTVAGAVRNAGNAAINRRRKRSR